MPGACRTQNLLGAGDPHKHEYHHPFLTKKKCFDLVFLLYSQSFPFPLFFIFLFFRHILTPQDTPQGGVHPPEKGAARVAPEKKEKISARTRGVPMQNLQSR